MEKLLFKSRTRQMFHEKDELNIKAKVVEQGIPMALRDCGINRGIITGFNEAFVISSEQKDKFIEQDPASAKILKPLLRGKDIVNWRTASDNLWLICTHNGIKSQGIPKIDADNYPAVYQWLQKFEFELAKRHDKGDHWSNLRNCNYIQDFEQPKIIYGQHKLNFEFIYDDTEHFYCDNTAFIITGKQLKYLTCFLNSKLFRYCFKDKLIGLYGEEKPLLQTNLDTPVKRINETQELVFDTLVDYVTFLRKPAMPKASPYVENYQIISTFVNIINAAVTELYFEQETRQQEINIIGFCDFVPINNLDNQQKANIIYQAYTRVLEYHNPIRNRMLLANIINPSITIINSRF